MIEPDIDWQWCRDDQQLILQTGQQAFVTSVCAAALPGCAVMPFTLQQAEWFWLARHALESLNWPAQAVSQACVDAVAQLSFVAEHGDKSFYLQSHRAAGQVAEFSLVQLLGHNYALALVLATANGQYRVMLLSELDTITGRTLPAGRTLLLRADRLLACQPPAAHMAKSA